MIDKDCMTVAFSIYIDYKVNCMGLMIDKGCMGMVFAIGADQGSNLTFLTAC